MLYPIESDMRIEAAGRSCAGRMHERNEDYVWQHPEAGVFVVADGGGSSSGGHVASRLAAAQVGSRLSACVRAGMLRRPGRLVRTFMVDAFEAANFYVQTRARLARQEQASVTTMVAALIQGSQAAICHAGDTRAYLVRNQQLQRLTNDHVMVMRAVGDLAAAAGETVVTKVIGQPGSVDPDYIELQLYPADWLLLCSDGFWDAVSESRILQSLHAAGDPARAVDSLMAIAQQSSHDDVSLVALHVRVR